MEGLYDDVVEFAKGTIQAKVRSTTAGGGLQNTPQPVSTSHIIYTTVKELAERKLSLSKVRMILGGALVMCPFLMQRLTFMRTDTNVKGRPVLAVHLGDATTMLGQLTYRPEEINKALENNSTFGAPLRDDVIRPFNKPGVERENIINDKKMISRKRVVAVYLSSLPKDLANSIVRGIVLIFHFALWSR